MILRLWSRYIVECYDIRKCCYVKTLIHFRSSVGEQYLTNRTLYKEIKTNRVFFKTDKKYCRTKENCCTWFDFCFIFRIFSRKNKYLCPSQFSVLSFVYVYFISPHEYYDRWYIFSLTLKFFPWQTFDWNVFLCIQLFSLYNITHVDC